MHMQLITYRQFKLVVADRGVPVEEQRYSEPTLPRGTKQVPLSLAPEKGKQH